jgi:hypothetical protein
MPGFATSLKDRSVSPLVWNFGLKMSPFFPVSTLILLEVGQCRRETTWDKTLLRLSKVWYLNRIFFCSLHSPFSVQKQVLFHPVNPLRSCIYRHIAFTWRWPQAYLWSTCCDGLACHTLCRSPLLIQCGAWTCQIGGAEILQSSVRVFKILTPSTVNNAPFLLWFIFHCRISTEAL